MVQAIAGPLKLRGSLTELKQQVKMGLVLEAEDVAAKPAMRYTD
jgi:hypothetical protein